MRRFVILHKLSGKAAATSFGDSAELRCSPCFHATLARRFRQIDERICLDTFSGRKAVRFFLYLAPVP